MNLHRMLEDVIASGRMEEFVRELPGVVVVKEELWTQLFCYVTNQLERGEVGLQFMQENHPHRDHPQTERYIERVENAERVVRAMESREPLELSLCTCWHTSNRGLDGEALKHPNGFDCRDCRNTGKVQLR